MFGIKGQCLGLISSASMSVQQTPLLNYNGGCIILRKLTVSFVPQMQRFALPCTHFTQGLGYCESWASVQKIGGRRTEAKPKSHINCLELMAVIFGLKTFCSRKSDSPYLHIFEQYDC